VRFAAIAPSGTSALILAGFSAVQIVSLSGTAIDLGNAHGIAMAAWSPDSSSVSWNVASSPTIETVNVADPALIWSRELPSGSLAALAMSANGVVLAAMQDDLAAALYSFSSDAAPRLLTMCPPLAGLTLN
jgi:hypothetical protein